MDTIFMLIIIGLMLIMPIRDLLGKVHDDRDRK